MFERNEFRMLALALLASACAPMGATWSPVQSPKAIAVNIAAESYVVKLDRRAKALPTGEHEELKQFLAHLGDLSTVEFSIRRTHKNLNVEALVPVEKELIALGADPRRIFRLAEIGFDYQAQYADVEIIAKRYVATAPSCPDWARPDIGDGLNENSSNFGCATASALALSIADPRDLARGRETGPASGAHEVAGVTRYDTDNVKPLNQTSSQKQD
jgi:pilus biogenesis lipoprotein CpaD